MDRVTLTLSKFFNGAVLKSADEVDLTTIVSQYFNDLFKIVAVYLHSSKVFGNLVYAATEFSVCLFWFLVLN